MKFIRRFLTYLNEARLEVRKVNWPTRSEVVHKTMLVIVFSAVITAVLGGFDVLFNRGVLKLLSGQEQAQEFNIEDFAPEGTSEPIEIEVGGDDDSGVSVELLEETPEGEEGE